MDPDTIILSPHFDDAILSCWHLLASAGEVLVVNVFAGEPPAGTLGWWDELAGATDSAAAVRPERVSAVARCGALALGSKSRQGRRFPLAFLRPRPRSDGVIGRRREFGQLVR